MPMHEATDVLIGHLTDAALIDFHAATDMPISSALEVQLSMSAAVIVQRYFRILGLLRCSVMLVLEPSGVPLPAFKMFWLSGKCQCNIDPVI
ncbi:MAG: hypothetical protein ACYDCO_16340 [Armatimonadota bacterium]